MISLENISATKFAMNGIDMGMKWLALLNLSTTTRIVDFPDDSGRWVIKSIVSSSQMAVGVGIGCSSPTGL